MHRQDQQNMLDWLEQIVIDSIDQAVAEVQARMASHMQDVHDTSWEQACEVTHFQEAIYKVEATPPTGNSVTLERRHRSRSPRCGKGGGGSKGGSGYASCGGTGSGSASSGGTGGEDGNVGKVGKGRKGRHHRQEQHRRDWLAGASHTLIVHRRMVLRAWCF